MHSMYSPRYVPVKPLIVIGAGFPRTGTASTQAALEILLNAQCHHMHNVAKHKEHEQWAALYSEGWKKQGDNIMRLLNDKYRCTIDLPTMMYWKELLACNPGAKVLLTVRDNFYQWHESVMGTVYAVYKMYTRAPSWVHSMMPRAKHMATILSGFFGKAGLFQGRFEDREFARGVYDAFIEDVKRTVPPDQLLVFNVKQGWGPLCKFLNVPVPKMAFPSVNDGEAFKQGLPGLRRRIRSLTYGPPLLIAGLGYTAVRVAVRLVKRR